MKREVSRKRVLPVFSIDIAELGLLWQRLIELFPEPVSVHCSFTAELPLETLKFSNFQELSQYSGLPETLSEFSLWLHQGHQHVSLRSNTLMGSRPEVSASGESEAWCAGAVETVSMFALQHKAWYSWLAAAPIGWLLLILSNLPWLAVLFVPPDSKPPRTAVYAWLALTVAFALLYAARSKFFPTVRIVVRSSELFLRRYVGELSLFVAVLSAVLTVVGWFLSK